MVQSQFLQKFFKIAREFFWHAIIKNIVCMNNFIQISLGNVVFLPVHNTNVLVQSRFGYYSELTFFMQFIKLDFNIRRPDATKTFLVRSDSRRTFNICPIYDANYESFSVSVLFPQGT